MHQAENGQTNKKIVYLAFGSNAYSQPMGCVEIIQSAYALLSAEDIEITRFSPFFQTPAFPAGNGPDFANSVVQIQVPSLNAEKLLMKIHNIEGKLGRKREKRWGKRTIDIDLLDYNGCVMPNEESYLAWRNMPLDRQILEWPDQLILPHPRIEDRAFVLVPLKTIAPNWIHPYSSLSIDQLIADVPAKDLAGVRQLNIT